MILPRSRSGSCARSAASATVLPLQPNQTPPLSRSAASTPTASPPRRLPPGRRRDPVRDDEQPAVGHQRGRPRRAPRCSQDRNARDIGQAMPGLASRPSASNPNAHAAPSVDDAGSPPRRSRRRRRTPGAGRRNSAQCQQIVDRAALVAAGRQELHHHFSPLQPQCPRALRRQPFRQLRRPPQRPRAPGGKCKATLKRLSSTRVPGCVAANSAQRRPCRVPAAGSAAAPPTRRPSRRGRSPARAARPRSAAAAPGSRRCRPPAGRLTMARAPPSRACSCASSCQQRRRRPRASAGVGAMSTRVPS